MALPASLKRDDRARTARTENPARPRAHRPWPSADQRGDQQREKEYIDKLMLQREAEAKKARQLKKKQAYKPDAEASFSGRQIRQRAADANALSFTPGRSKAFAVRRRTGRLLAGFSIATTGRLMPAVFGFAFAFGFASEDEFSISLKRSISSSSVRSRHSPSGIPVRLTFMIRVRSSFVTS